MIKFKLIVFSTQNFFHQEMENLMPLATSTNSCKAIYCLDFFLDPFCLLTNVGFTYGVHDF